MLKDRLKFLLKDTALYGVANGISRFIVFLTIPIIVKQIDVAEFGSWNLLTILGGIVSAVAIFGMDSAVVRYFYENESPTHRNNVFSQGLFSQLALVSIFITLGLLAPRFFLEPINLDGNYRISLNLILLWVPANIFTQYFQNWFKWTFQRSNFLTIALGTTGINLLFLFAYIKFGSLGLNSILIIQAISAWIFMLVGLWWCRKNLIFKIDQKMVGTLLVFGFPMMLVMVMSLVSPALDRIFLVRYLNPEQLGIYSFCQKLSIMMMVVVAAFQTAFGPFSFSIWDKPQAKDTFSRFQSYYLIVAGVIAIGICSFSKPLILLFGTPLYLESGKYLPLLVLAALVYGLYSFAVIGIFYSKKMIFNLMALSVGLGSNLAVNFILIPFFQEYGAVIGYLTGNVVMVGVGYFFSNKFYKIPYSLWKDVFLVVVLSSLLLATNLDIHKNIFLEAFMKTGMFLPFFLIIALLLLTNQEKAFLKRKLSRS